MKKLLLFILLIPVSGFSQKVIDKVKVVSGRFIIIYDDKTWEYSDETKQTQSKIQGFVNTETNETKTQPVTSRSTSTAIPKKTTTTRSTNTPTRSTTSSYCGARTQKGGSCRRLVKGGGRCYQH